MLIVPYISSFTIILKIVLFIDLERKEEGRERERERETLICCSFFNALIGCFFSVLWPGIKPATLVYGEDILTNWVTPSGDHFLSWRKQCNLFYLFILLLFNYSCLHFLPTPPPHPSLTHLSPPPPPSHLVLSMCPL